MIVKYVIPFLLMAGLIVQAQADELDDAYNICRAHENIIDPAHMRQGDAMRYVPFQSGWEHCIPIKQQWAKRDIDKKASDEATNPDLKKTRDLARKLSGSVP